MYDEKSIPECNQDDFGILYHCQEELRTAQLSGRPVGTW